MASRRSSSPPPASASTTAPPKAAKATAKASSSSSARPAASRAAPISRPASLVCTDADADFAHGRWRQAAAGYAGVVAACPLHLRARLRVGDALLNLGHQGQALDVYRAVHGLAVIAGAPLLGLVAQKIVTLLEPGADDGASALAEQYARGADRLDALLPPLSAVQAGNEPATPLVDDAALLATASAVASAMPRGTRPAPNVPPIPLFSYLDEDDFVAALECLRLRRFCDGEVIIRQGERSESVFIIADGEVGIVRGGVGDDSDGDGEHDVTLARLRGGAVFGELALISDEPRQASAVAVGDVDVLEMRRSDLVVAAAHIPGLSEALRLFTRERFLRNLTATHPFFAPLGRDDRHRVMELTRILTFQAGDVLIQEGQRGPGLFVLLGGLATVKKALPLSPGEPLQHIHLASLRGGDLCGEMSMLNDAPTNATVTCTADMEALFLSRDAFKAVTAEHPELLRYLAGVTDERLRKNRALLHGRGLLEDDEHVMI